MNPHHIIITQHAWDRFQERWCEDRPKCWLRELHRLLRSSTREDLGHAAVLRLIAHNYQPATYYRAGEWRFVLDEDSIVLLTCEWAFKKGIKLRHMAPFNRKRHGG